MKKSPKLVGVVIKSREMLKLKISSPEGIPDGFQDISDC